MGNTSERRQHPRWPMSFPVLLSSERGKVAVGLVQNASAGGLLVATARRLPVGEPVEVRFRSDATGGFTTLTGIVVRHVERRVGGWSPELVAVRFAAERPEVGDMLTQAQRAAWSLRRQPS